ncbi:MAG: hypothetical protein AB1403_25375 [Candidatus Riflebacteria bacterium]
MNRHTILPFVMLLLFVFSISSIHGGPKNLEKELLKKGHELSYEGQVDKAKELMGEDSKEAKKAKDGSDDGFYSLFLSMLWGAIGTGFFIYGKKQSAALFLLCGIGLCVFPFFVGDPLISLVLGLIMCIAPFKIAI